ncbi:hypothetical protein [Pseudomonas aeruginosa]|uniref:hypothetical protein n=1 Tax=Pseudomonas aeruginosa TaxID=287 RepID=UPI003DA93E0C
MATSPVRHSPRARARFPLDDALAISPFNVLAKPGDQLEQDPVDLLAVCADLVRLLRSAIDGALGPLGELPLQPHFVEDRPEARGQVALCPDPVAEHGD